MNARTHNVLIAALGGEGGGALAGWIVTAATIAGYPVQSTSIPGVAQRTGATTYYIELFPQTLASLAGARPVLALTPMPGDVDLVVASELVEAGRAMQNGYVTPDRTTLIASQSRVYAIGERIAMADGRFDAERIEGAAAQLARRAILRDFAALAQASGTPLNAVLLGALIASGVLPLGRAEAEEAIRRAGKAAESNLRGFDLGFRQSRGPAEERTVEPVRPPPPATDLSEFPAAARNIIARGVERLTDYQGAAYARLYLDRLRPVALADRSPDYALIKETARYLALWMSYEDVIRVADLKTGPGRQARVRGEVRAKDGDIVRVVEYLKPGVAELCSMLPASLGRALSGLARARGWERKPGIGMCIRSTSVSGFLLLRLLAGLRWWRPHSWRYAEEQSRIERWLAAIGTAAARDAALAQEIAGCGQLMKGYGDTHARAVRSFELIAARCFGGDAEPAELARAVSAARRAALADPDGEALSAALAASKPRPPRRAAAAE
jgi:indolepyruvate ferredoxin oxidoreductase beta subunit